MPCHVDQNLKTVVEGQGICRGELEYRRPQHESARIYSRRGQCDLFFASMDGNVVQLIISELRCWLQQSSRPFVSLRENGKCHVLLMISELRCRPQRSSRPPANCCKPKVARRATLHRRFGISFRSSCSQGRVVGLGTWEAASSDFFRVPPQRSV